MPGCNLEGFWAKSVRLQGILARPGIACATPGRNLEGFWAKPVRLKGILARPGVARTMPDRPGDMKFVPLATQRMWQKLQGASKSV